MNELISQQVQAISFGGGGGGGGGNGGKFGGGHATVSSAMCHASNNKGMACRTVGKALSNGGSTPGNYGIAYGASRSMGANGA